MRFSITGGSDVTGSAERAPLRPALFDRLAVGVITVANSDPVAKASEDNGRISAPMSGEVSRPHGADHARGTPLAIRRDGSERRSPDSPSRSLTSSQAAVKPEADTLLPFVSGASSNPDPRTLAGADGRRSTPSLLAVGAKSDGVAASSSVGAASERNVGVHESRQAVPYSPWAVRRSSNSLRSVYP